MKIRDMKRLDLQKLQTKITDELSRINNLMTTIDKVVTTTDKKKVMELTSYYQHKLNKINKAIHSIDNKVEKERTRLLKIEAKAAIKRLLEQGKII